MEDMIKVKIKDLKYYPKEIPDSLYKPLTKSIEKHGIIHPIYVTKNLCLVDGYARIHVAIILGIEEIVAMVVGDSSAIEFNPNVKRLLEADELRVKSRAVLSLMKETCASQDRCREALEANDYDIDKAKWHLMRQPKKGDLINER